MATSYGILSLGRNAINSYRAIKTVEAPVLVCLYCASPLLLNVILKEQAEGATNCEICKKEMAKISKGKLKNIPSLI